MKDYILLRKYINEALRGDIENIEINPDREKSFFQKTKDLKGLKSTDSKFRGENIHNKNIETLFKNYQKNPEFQEKLKNFEKTNSFEDNINRFIYDERNKFLNSEDFKSQIEKQSTENEDELIQKFKNKFTTKNAQASFAARVKNYEGINFKIFTIPTHINLINLLKKVIQINNINEKEFIAINSDDKDESSGLYERIYAIKNDERKIKELIDSLIKFQLIINSNKGKFSNSDLNIIDKLTLGFKKLIRNFTDTKNEELFEIISLFEKIYESSKTNNDDCIILTYGIFNTDDLRNKTDQNLARSPWMTIHRLFDTYVNSDTAIRSDIIYSKYSESFSNFFKKLSFKGFDIYMDLLKKNNFNFKFNKENCDLDVYLNNNTDRERFDSFNKEVYSSLEKYPPIPKLKKGNLLYNRYVSPVNLNETLPGRINNFEHYQGYYTCIFKFQSLTGDKHMVNRNSDFVNELMTYLLGILKNKSNGTYNIVSKPKNSEAIQKSLDIEGLIDHIFLTDLTNFMKEHFSSEYSQFKKEVMIPMINDILENLDTTLDFYKGKIVLIGK